MKWGAEVVEDIAEHYEKCKKEIEENREKIKKSPLTTKKITFGIYFSYVLNFILWFILTLYIGNKIFDTANPIIIIQDFFSYKSAQAGGLFVFYFIFTYPACGILAHLITEILNKLFE